MAAGFRAGMAYFAFIFVAGLAAGIVRDLILEPALGEFAAAAIELAAMLGFAWWICRKLIDFFHIADRTAAGMMGATAFVALIGAELAMALYTPSTRIADHVAAYRETARWIGLVGQILFAAMPSLAVARSVQRARKGAADEVDPAAHL